jgi:23S rRNA (uracil1939-C5)-methyltransferase
MAVATITLNNMAHGGDAVGQHEGQAVFVPLGIPGETVRVQLEEARRGVLRARLLEVLEPSPDRVEPPCRYFGLCGGCQWQHIAYPAQLRYKQEIVRGQMERIGHLDVPVNETLGMADPWRYRNHVQLRLDRRGRIGYYALRSHDVVPVEECLVIHELLDDLWGALDVEWEDLDRISLRAGLNTGEQMVVLEGSDAEPPELEVDFPVNCVYAADAESLYVLAGDSHYHERLGELTFQVSGPSFFQVKHGTGRAPDRTRGAGAGATARRKAAGRLLWRGHLCALAGRRRRPGAGHREFVWSVGDALANADAAGVGEEFEFMDGDVAETLEELGETFDAVVLDPPRAGCTPETIAALAGTCAGRIAYVSCDPPPWRGTWPVRAARLSRGAGAAGGHVPADLPRRDGSSSSKAPSGPSRLIKIDTQDRNGIVTMTYTFRFFTEQDFYLIEKLVLRAYQWEVPLYGLSRHEFSKGLHPAFVECANSWRHTVGIFEESEEIVSCAISEGNYEGDAFFVFDSGIGRKIESCSPGCCSRGDSSIDVG